MLHRTPGIVAMLSTLVLSKDATFSHHLRLATLSLHTPLPLRTLRWNMPAPVLETPVKVTNIRTFNKHPLSYSPVRSALNIHVLDHPGYSKGDSLYSATGEA